MEIEPIFQHAKHISNYFLKLRQWKLDRDEVKLIMDKCVEHYVLWTTLPVVQTTSWSPIHLAALLDDVVSLKQILHRDPKCFNTVYTNFYVTPIMCAAYSGAMDCVNYLLTFFVPVVLQTPKALVFWAVKGENLACCTKLLELNIFENTQPDLYELIATDALGDNVKMLTLILKHWPKSAFFQTGSGDNMVYLAAGKGLPNVLKHLLQLGVAVDTKNKFGISPLHTAILQQHCTDESAVRILEILLENGANPNYETIKNRETPLYYAAGRGFSKCVFTLLKHGAIIDTRQTIQKLNAEIPNFFQDHLNSLVTLTGVSNSYSQVLVAINLSFTGNLNNQADLSETYFLKFLVMDGQEKYLLHPVIETYLAVKWKFVRRFFFVSFGLYLLTVVLFSLYVLDTYVLKLEGSGDPLKEEKSLPISRDHRTNLYWWLSSITVVMRIVSHIIRFSATFSWRFSVRFFRAFSRDFRRQFYLQFTRPAVYNFKKREDLQRFVYFKVKVWVQWALFVGLVVTLGASLRWASDIPEWLNTLAGFTVFTAWAFVLDYLRTQPTLGIYVEMLLKVFVNLVRFLLTYVCLLLGFVISFMVLYKGQGPFASFPHALLRVLNMMVGEMGFDTMFLERMHGSNGNETESTAGVTADNLTAVHVLFVIFIITVTIALINLLIGLAVSDIKGLRKRSKLHKTLKQISFIADLERFICSKTARRILPTRLMNYLDLCIQLPSSHHTIYVYPNNSNDRRLPKLLKMEALQIAIRNNMEQTGEEVVKNKMETQLLTIQTQLEYLVKQKRGIQ